MSVTLANLLAESTETTRNSTTGALDDTKRTRAINRILQDLQDYGDWDFTKRVKSFDFSEGVFEYSLETDFACVCFESDGTTEVVDVKSPFDLRAADKDLYHKPFVYRDVKDVRENIRKGSRINEYAIDGDTLVVNHSFPDETEVEFEYYSLAMVKTSDDAYKLEFDSDNVTQTDVLLGGITAQRTVIAGTSYELFKIVGGKSERDRTDSYKEYVDKKKDLLKRAGRRIRRPCKVLNFPTR